MLSINWSLFIDENFAVRVKRIDSDIDTVATERKIGSLILSKTDGISVNLSNPKSFIRVIANENDLYLCYGKYQLNKNPHKGGGPCP